MQVQPDVCALTVEASSATIIVRGVPSTWPAISTGYHAGPSPLMDAAIDSYPLRVQPSRPDLTCTELPRVRLKNG